MRLGSAQRDRHDLKRSAVISSLPQQKPGLSRVAANHSPKGADWLKQSGSCDVVVGSLT